MTDPMVVTNLRLPRSDWLEIKSIAGGFGVSTNQYINEALNFVTKVKELAFTPKSVSLKDDPIWDWPNLAKKIKDKPMGTSEEDKIIYGV